MATYHDEIKQKIREDADGNITTDTTRTTKCIRKSEEPDYIKIYTKMFLDFKGIPEKWHTLFFALACRMSYASTGKNHGGQIVYTVGTQADDIIEACGWKTKDPLYKGLKALCASGAIRQIGRGEYQINPQYAGRGGWYYDKNQQNGGIKDLIAQFDFANQDVSTQIIWATDDKEIIGDADEVLATRTIITPDSAAVAAATDIEVSDDTQQTPEKPKRRKKTA